jgi:ubiquinone/menaquinone biosynthesis C-methylase UbiE
MTGCVRLIRGVIVIVAVLGATRPAFAQLGARSADEWIQTLESKTRLDGLKVPETVAALKLKPGQIVADIGAGSGLYTIPLALAVKPGGTVYAVDIDKELVHFVTERATEQGVINVEGAVGTPEDPNMPVNVDVALINDVLHHIEKRPEYLKQLAAYLNPGGRIAIVEFKPDQSPHKANPALVVSEEQTTAWMAAAGLKLVDRVSLYTDKWFVIYGAP